MMIIKNFINGEIVSPVSGNYFDNPTPVTGQVYSQISDSDITEKYKNPIELDKIRNIIKKELSNIKN